MALGVFKKITLAMSLMFGQLVTPLYADALGNLPSLGDGGAGNLSVQDERRLGELIMKDYRAFGAVTDDPEINAYLNLLGERIVQAAGESPSNFEFFLVADPSINAFALPGGFIGVHTGLLAAARTEDELASVLAHEVGHVTQRHIARMYSQQKDTSLVSTAALIAALLVASSNPQAAQGIAAAGAGYQLEKQLSFSRDAEREADRVGFTTLLRAGYQAEGMVTFFERLQQSTRLYENNAPSYLRTHPLTTERIADIQNRAGLDRVGSKSSSQAPIEYELMRMRALVYSDNSPQRLKDRLESLQASRALEQLGYAYEAALLYGQSLVYSKLDRMDQSLELVQRAIETERRMRTVVKNHPVPLLMTSHQMDLLLAKRQGLNGGADVLSPLRTREDLNEQDKLLLDKLTDYREQYKGVYSVKVDYVKGLQSMGLFAESEAQIRDMLIVYRSRAELYDLLARASLAQGDSAQYHLALAQAYSAKGAYRPAIEQAQLARRYAAGNYYLTAEIEALQKQYKAKVDEERRFAENFK
jgi:beta-barrel assembly-enhancing protease